MSYIYETHLHTVESSACGKSHGAEYIKYYKELGYAGIIVTDHFFNGNCAVPKDLPWEERIERFCRGYELTKEAGDKENFPVFFGWEDCFHGDEYLVYGLDKEWLLAHPDMLSWDHSEHYRQIHEAGGLVVQAHPFRDRDYLTGIHLHPHQSDAWEIQNACNPLPQDIPSILYAKKHNFPVTAGSDIHNFTQAAEKNCFGVSFDTPLTSIKDYVERIKKGTDYELHVTDARAAALKKELSMYPDKPSNHLTIPLYLYDENNKPERVFFDTLFN